MLFYNSFSTSYPKGRIMHGLRAMWPGIADKCFSLHSDLKLNGGSASAGDVVSWVHNGMLQVGRLHLAVGVTTDDEAELYALVARWECLDRSDKTCYSMKVQHQCVQIPVRELDTVFVHRFSSDAKTCNVIIPYECRL